jgi:hypothetical protein
MTLLEKARRIAAAILARRNGHHKKPVCAAQGYEINELNEKSPPGGGDWIAPGLSVEETRTPFDPEPGREPGEEG